MIDDIKKGKRCKEAKRFADLERDGGPYLETCCEAQHKLCFHEPRKKPT